MASYYLMMDVGGTGIKAGVLDRNGKLCGKIQRFAARAKESAEVIFSNFASIIEQMGENFLDSGDIFCGIGMAFPGPFDYAGGISLMKGLDKYDAIYGMDIRKEVLKRISEVEWLEKKEECPFLFLHDVEAFALGESTFGAAAQCSKLFCLCIGTGAGSAFVRDGQVLKHGENIPADGWIYAVPYKESIIDDYVSARGLQNVAKQHLDRELTGEALAELAGENKEEALQIFEEFGVDVLAAVQPFLESFCPDGMVLGGQIAKSFSYFGTPLEQLCREKNIQVYVTTDTSERTLEGLYAGFVRQRHFTND